jgi:hypothetical protein
VQQHFFFSLFWLSITFFAIFDIFFRTLNYVVEHVKVGCKKLKGIKVYMK